MYKLLIPVMFAVFVFSAAFNSNAYVTAGKDKPVVAPKSIGRFIYQVQLDKAKDPKLVRTGWYDEFLEPDANGVLFDSIFSKVLRHAMPVYLPYYPFTGIMDSEKASLLIRTTDSVEIEDPNNPGTLVIAGIVSELQPEEIVSVIFDEEWFFDAATMKLVKKVKGIIPIVHTEDYTGELNGARPLFYVPFNDGEMMSTDFHAEEISYDYSTDTNFIKHDFYPVSVEADIHQEIKQDSTAARMLIDVREFTKVKKAIFNKPAYPYNVVVAEKEKTALFPLIDRAEHMRFSEEWSADLERMIFKKEVHGIILGEEQRLQLGDQPAQYFMLHHVFVPLNGYKYQLDMSGLEIPHMAYGATYQYNPNFAFPVYATKDSLALTKMLFSICDHAKAQRISIYGDTVYHRYFDAWDQSNQPLDSRGVKNMFGYQLEYFREDPMNPEGGENVSEYREYGSEDYCGFMFYEKWRFDPVAMTFDKDINAIAVQRYEMDGMREYTRSAANVFGYYPAAVKKDSMMQAKYLVAKNIQTPVQVNWNDYYADESYDGYIYQYYPNEFYNLETSVRYHLLQTILTQVTAGKLPAWRTDDPTKQYTVPEFNQMLDTVAARNSIAFGRTFAFAGFTEWTFHEDWYYNPSTAQLYKHVTAITFGTRNYMIGSVGPEETWKDSDPKYFTVRVNQAAK